MITTATDVTTISEISHREAGALAETEYGRFADTIAELEPGDWSRDTACTGWTVRDMVGHMVGAMRSAASLREMLRQQREIKRRVEAHGGNEVDHMTALQIELTRDLDTAALVEEVRGLVRPAARGRMRTPWPMRRFVSFPVEMGEISEQWRLGYLVDVILTRDAWMHRVDISRAVGAPLMLTPDHDGRIVADIVAEWARRHDRPFDLTLTGAAGGSFTAPGDAPEHIEIDAVEFCLALSGRRDATGLLGRPVPF